MHTLQAGGDNTSDGATYRPSKNPVKSVRRGDLDELPGRLMPAVEESNEDDNLMTRSRMT